MTAIYTQITMEINIIMNVKMNGTTEELNISIYFMVKF